jgi:hypothetical protein
MELLEVGKVDSRLNVDWPGDSHDDLEDMAAREAFLTLTAKSC